MRYERVAVIVFWMIVVLAVAAVFFPPIWPVPVTWAILATKL